MPLSTTMVGASTPAFTHDVDALDHVVCGRTRRLQSALISTRKPQR
jgi:hypothetical protein